MLILALLFLLGIVVGVRITLRTMNIRYKRFDKLVAKIRRLLVTLISILPKNKLEKLPQKRDLVKRALKAKKRRINLRILKKSQRNEKSSKRIRQ